MRKPVILPVVLLVIVLGCGPGGKVQITTPQAPAVEELWEDPVDLPSRDLFSGPGGPHMTPDANEPYEFVAHKRTGKNPGYDVRTVDGRVWSVKLGEEAQPEVVTSRLLWAIGFHQPPTYYLEKWTLSGEDAGLKPGSRFRFEPDGHEVIDDWSWYDNPFVGTQPFRGLIVAQLIFNNWDWKTSNNKIYVVSNNGGSRRIYMVRDLGASFGKARQSPIFKWLNIRHLQGTKNDLPGFEQQPFIDGFDGEQVKFSYSGLDKALVQHLTHDDVRWVCERLAGLTDRQWHDAFRAANYDDDEIVRYVRKIKEKINQGLNAGKMVNRDASDASLPIRVR
jgi:hypothetical protein